MPAFKVMVEGHNFPGDEQDGKLGFFTTRFVSALDPVHAEEKAKALVEDEYDSLMKQGKTPWGRPFLTIDAVEEIETLPTSSGAGATWYPAEKDN